MKIYVTDRHYITRTGNTYKICQQENRRIWELEEFENLDEVESWLVEHNFKVPWLEEEDDS